MSKFIVIYHARAPYMQMMQEKAATQEEMQAEMQAWMEWAGRCGEGLTEMGGPMTGSLKLTSEGSSASDRGIVGYSILEAADMGAAQAMLEGHPHFRLDSSCEIEVHEVMQMPSQE
ncbi:MAG: YciI family protein [Chloroflexi bacterium]|nr:YciI family protein [Chloroflexota bacterium]